MTDDELRDLYRQMVTIREFESRILRLRLDGEIEGVVHPYIGEEAIAVGVCAHLRRDDAMTSTHRGHGHCIAKGADLGRMMAELFGRIDGFCGGKGGSMHIADFEIGMLGANGIVAAGLPIACGSALAAQLRDSDQVTACMFGDGVAGAGPFHECLNIAGLQRLPIVFVCEDNGWAANSVSGEMLSGTPASIAAGHQVRSTAVDGTDVLDVAAAMEEAVAVARGGEGPTLIVARCFRYQGHAYRNVDLPLPGGEEERRAWLERDPIPRFAEELARRGVELDPEAVSREVEEELGAAEDFARNSPVPALD
ncbi:MAG: thiamine pyrophosphate-dependent dehydrogenase E1 component subunit alpha, partial [Actinobacteria bacterium]|nr:thiamine pyrophosphate-dependent dehydrogenase E1 component subunit alpha [Actinomycetota bacterium]